MLAGNGWKNNKKRNWKKKKQMGFFSLMMRIWNKGEKLLIIIIMILMGMLMTQNRLKLLISFKVNFNLK
jgi:hypothetical protein